MYWHSGRIVKLLLIPIIYDNNNKRNNICYGLGAGQGIEVEMSYGSCFEFIYVDPVTAGFFVLQSS
jgi:hypothetical protein